MTDKQATDWINANAPADLRWWIHDRLRSLASAPCSALILARDVLREVEWKGNEKESRCIVCYGHCSKGHEPECSLARAAWNLGEIIQQNTPAQDNQT